MFKEAIISKLSTGLKGEPLSLFQQAAALTEETNGKSLTTLLTELREGGVKAYKKVIKEEAECGDKKKEVEEEDEEDEKEMKESKKLREEDEDADKEEDKEVNEEDDEEDEKKEKVEEARKRLREAKKSVKEAEEDEKEVDEDDEEGEEDEKKEKVEEARRRLREARKLVNSAEKRLAEAKEDDEEVDEEEDDDKKPEWLIKKEKEAEEAEEDEKEVSEAKKGLREANKALNVARKKLREALDVVPGEDYNEEEDDIDGSKKDINFYDDGPDGSPAEKPSAETKRAQKMEESVRRRLNAIGRTSKKAISEDVSAMFAGEKLTEDFKGKASLIFEAAVTRQVNAYKKLVESSVNEIIEEEVQTISEELTNKIDKYLDYVVEEWMSENQLAIEAGIRTEITEGFISGLKNLFLENYIHVPKGKENILAKVTEEKLELEEEFEIAVQKNIELVSEIKDLKKGIIISELSKGLADTQAEKLTQLAESVDFEGTKDFTKKVSQIKESYFSKFDASKSKSVSIDEGGLYITEDTTKVKNKAISSYVNAISRQIK